MMGIGKQSFMGKGSDQPMEDDSQEEQQGGKLLALQNILDAIEGIADEDLKPYIEDMKSKIHMEHEAAEGDQMGMEDSMKPKAGLDVEIGMGKPEDSEPEEDEEDSTPKGGFLAVLTKKMSSKK